jgi:hypothetical protein
MSEKIAKDRKLRKRILQIEKKMDLSSFKT